MNLIKMKYNIKKNIINNILVLSIINTIFYIRYLIIIYNLYFDI